MQRFVGGEVGLSGIEKLLDDRDKVLWSLPSKSSLSFAMAVGFDLLDQHLDLRLASVGSDRLVGRNNRPRSLSAPGFDRFYDLGGDSTAPRESLAQPRHRGPEEIRNRGRPGSASAGRPQTSWLQNPTSGLHDHWTCEYYIASCNPNSPVILIQRTNCKESVSNTLAFRECWGRGLVIRVWTR